MTKRKAAKKAATKVVKQEYKPCPYNPIKECKPGCLFFRIMNISGTLQKAAYCRDYMIGRIE